MFEGPRVEGHGGECGAMVHRDRPRRRAGLADAVEGRGDVGSGDPLDHLLQRTLATALIDDREHTERPAVGPLIVHKVYAPALPCAPCGRHRPAVPRPMAALSHAQPYLQSLESVETAQLLQMHAPSLPAQQDENTRVAEARLRLGQLPNTKTEGRLIARAAPPIPRGPTEAGQSTGPYATDPKAILEPLRCGASTGRRHPLSRSASASTCLSSLRSATRRFSRLFSSSSYRRRRISFVQSCANLCFQT